MSARSCTLPTLSALPVALLLLTTAHTAEASTYGKVERATWGTGNEPSWIDMYMATPDTPRDKPPIIVNIHSCGNTAGGQWGYAGFEELRVAIDSIGYIMIIPQATGRNCWDVGSDASLTHGGGGDTGALVQMVQHVIETYGADPTRVYAMGGSGGGMMVQALMAVYPDVFKAGHARAGVPAGCWAVQYDQGGTPQWSVPCAGGQVTHTAQEWGDMVRDMFPGYTGPRPRLGINQGDIDDVISPVNFAEGIKEWTNVLGLPETPTSTDSNFQGREATYDRQFWSDSCGFTVFEAWSALGKKHSMGYEAPHILEWFGLDQVREQDPWDEQCGGQVGTGGAGNGSGGAGSGAGGTLGAGGFGASVGGTSAGVGGAGSGSGGTSAGSGGVGTGSGGVAAGAGGAGSGTGGTTVGTGGTGVPGNASSCALVTPAASKSALPWALLGLGYAFLRRRRAVS